MNERLQSIQHLLSEALEIADLQERAAFVSNVTREDPVLRRELEELLEADAQAGRFLPSRPVVRGDLLAGDRRDSPPDTSAAGILGSGNRLGGYKLLQQIGEGGCGIVYMAEQEFPVRKTLALKVIKLGMDTKQVVARFEAERQALARMDHPNIAKVFDAGVSDTGRPFFVMELVRGTRITDYCDTNELSTRRRLELFIQVCHAVQHAHQKGVVHRDLKPSNILVSVHDGAAVSKVIDFGIAKAIEGRLCDQTLHTGFEQVLGTPAYMSPEQAHATSEDIDTRTDIYSLGVLLYELLTGKTPFDTRELLALGLDELRRTIREKEPARPSARLREMLPNELRAAAKRRQSEAPKLIHLLRGDLDWIVMKCLDKDRNRRYATASGLAWDIRRHLDCEPVIARPPSRLYEFQKTVRRHKFGFITTAAVIVALSGGILVSTRAALRAKRAERQESRLRQAVAREAIRALRAEAQAKELLRGSYLAQAQAWRWSGRAGRRFEALELLKRAAAIRPSLELRNEAIACMALADMRVVREWQAFAEDTLICFDTTYERYAFGDRQGTLRIFRVEDGAELNAFPGYKPPFRDYHFSPDSRLMFVAAGALGDRAEVLDLSRGEVVLQVNESRYRTVSFSSDSKSMAVSYDRAELGFPIRIFDLNSMKEVASFTHGTLPYTMRFNPKRFEELLTSDTSRTVRVWDWQKARVLKGFEHHDWVRGIDWHPDGSLVATGCGDNSVSLWDAATGERRAAMAGHELAPVQVSFSSGGEFLASSGWDGTLRLWDVRAGREVATRAVAGYTYPFGRSRNHLAAILATGRVGILEASASECYRTLQPGPGSLGPFAQCHFSPDGQSLLCASKSGLELWDLRKARVIGRLAATEDSDYPASFDPQGSAVLRVSSNGVEEWGVDPSEPALFELHRRVPISLYHTSTALSCNALRLASGTGNSLIIYDGLTGMETHRLELAYSDVFSALSADCRLAATWTRLGRTVQIWDLPTSNLLQELPTRDLSVQVAFSANAEWLVVGDGAEYRVWDRHTWKTRYVLSRTAASFWGRMAFSPDSSILAAAITRSTLLLVEGATGRELAALQAPERMNISGIAFSPDGTQLAVTTGAGPVQIWNLRAIRTQLAAMNLDWELPRYP